MQDSVRRPHNNEMGGFSLIELLVVVAIVAVLAVLLVPPVLRTVSAFKLRSTAASVEALIQQTRMRAVRDDKFYTMRPAAIGNAAIYYLDLNESSVYTQGDDLVQLASDIQVVPETTAPAPLPAVGFTQDSADPVSFNSRGLPCLALGPAPTTCNTLVGGSQIGFVYYLMATPANAPPSYKAISVSPAGRVRIWTYSGGGWQ